MKSKMFIFTKTPVSFRVSDFINVSNFTQEGLQSKIWNLIVNSNMSHQILTRFNYLNCAIHIKCYSSVLYVNSLCLFLPVNFRRNIWDSIYPQMKHASEQINWFFRYSYSLSRKVGKVFLEGLIRQCFNTTTISKTSSVTFQIQWSLSNPCQVAE